MIFVYELTEGSKAVIGVEADTNAEADKKLEEWLDDDDHQEEYREYMDCTCHDNREVVRMFRNEDELNRCIDLTCDFLVTEKKVQKEPIYDLVLNFKFTPSHVETVVYRNLTTKEYAEKILELDKDYILLHTFPSGKFILDAFDRCARVEAYDVARRTN